MRALLLRPEPDIIVLYAFESIIPFKTAYNEISLYDNKVKILYKGLWWHMEDSLLSDIIMAKPKEIESEKDRFFKNYGNNRFDMTTTLSSFNSAMREVEFRDYIIIYKPALLQQEQETQKKKINYNQKKLKFRR